ncbi:hypothetical protein Q8A67_003272 [Cirrhinus molitorella]|uniref:Ig-like domain-containing protein n=1 Tax=Cirrhinus molitorella TaxID=172907 RepID=A0AA88Q7N9_9TELE|nr:hypothetical protein Q8A67_003272 [Cirrhinus molitorella]
MASEQEVRVSMHLITVFFIAVLLWRNEGRNNFTDGENHLCRIGDGQNNHHRRVLGLIIKPSWFPLHRLMKLKYLDEDTSSLIMEYMDTDSTSTQKVIQKTHGNLCYKFHLIVPDEAQSAEVKLGSDVTLACHLSPEISAADMEIRWFKETDCVCLYKNRQVTDGRSYRGRTGLSIEELDRGNVSLKLREFRESDIGVYLCQVISEDTTEEITVEVGARKDSGVQPVSQPSKTEDEQVHLKLHESDRTWRETQRIKMEESALMTELEVNYVKVLHQTIFKVFKNQGKKLEQTEIQLKESKMDLKRVLQQLQTITEKSGLLQNEKHLDMNDSQIQQTEKQLLQITKYIEEKQSQLHEKDTQLENISKQMSEKEKLLESTIKEMETSKQQLETLRQEQMRNKEMLEKSISEFSEKSKCLEETKSLLEERDRKIKDLENEKERLNEELQDKDKRLKDINAKLMQTVREVEKKQNQLQGKHTQLEREKMAAPCKNEFHLVISDESQNAVVKLGSDVTVPCHLSPAVNAVDMEIRWFKGTECVCLYMEKNMIPGMDYKGRVGLNKEIEKGNVSLEIKNFIESDGGDYLCQVTSGDRTEKMTVRLGQSLKTHEGTETIEKTGQEQTDEKKIEKSVLMAVFTELQDAKQKSREKDAEIEKLKAKLLQAGIEPEKEKTQLENIHKPAKDLETSQIKLKNPETETTPQLNIDPVQVQAQEMSQKTKNDEGESESMQRKRQRKTKEAKVFTFYPGNKNALHEVHKKCIGTLQYQIPNLREVETPDESDFTLILCPIVSRAGTDIDAALKQFDGNPGSKLAVLVVLHPTIDPEKMVLDSSKFVNRTDILTVDYLFNEDTGLMKCLRNSDADDKVKNWLKQGESESESVQRKTSETSSKLAVLVVLHPTIDPEKMVLDSSKFVNRTDILTVDYLFNEDTGLMKCLRNSDADDKVKNWLKQGESESESVQRKTSETKEAKVFTFYPGNKNALHEVHKKFIGTLQYQIPNLREVETPDESDFTLILCPIVSRAGTDIDAALKQFDGNPGSKLAVLVVLHPTIDPEKMVLDSSKFVNRTDILTVDYLFNEDTGLMKCLRNSDADDKVKNWLKQMQTTKLKTVKNWLKQVISKNTETAQKHQSQDEPQKSKNEAKVFTFYPGNKNALHEVHKKFIGTLQYQIPNLWEVETPDESDFTLILCPIVSRAGTDIDAALKQFDGNPGSKLAVLVVLHPTIDPEKMVLDSSKFVNRTDILTVDYLFNEDTGLMKCLRNSDADDKVKNWLKQKMVLDSSKFVNRTDILTVDYLFNEDTGLMKCLRNSDADDKVKNWLKQQVISKNTETAQKHQSQDEPQKSKNEAKVFTFYPGNKNALHEVHKKCIGTLQYQIPNLREVETPDESDFTLILCPIVSRAGTDIDAALKQFDGNPGSKLAVLVVLHPTIDPEKMVLDSSKFVNRTDILTVDYLFNEDTGLMKCLRNSDADDKVKNWLKQMQTTKLKTEEVNVFVILAGKTNKCDRKLIAILEKRSKNLREVCTVDKSDIIFVFCPIVSQARADIDAALNKLKCCTDSEHIQKPTVLVVLYHTFDPEKVVLDSSKYVNRTDILTVDYLFYEDTGLLECQKNLDSTDKVVNWLTEQSRHFRQYESTIFMTSRCTSRFSSNLLSNQMLSRIHSLRLLYKMKEEKDWKSQSVQRHDTVTLTDLSPDTEYEMKYAAGVKVFSILTGKTATSHKHIISTLQTQIEDLREVRTMDESDIIMVFCPIVSRAGTDIDAALKTFSHYIGETKIAVLVVLHHTFDTNKTISDSSKCVNRTDILTVDYLFYEDTGLMKCQKNSDSTEKVVNWLIQQGRKRGLAICPRQNKVFSKSWISSWPLGRP